MGPHTYTSCYYHTQGNVSLIFRGFCPSSSSGGDSWTIQLLPTNSVSQGSVGYLLYINKSNYQLNGERYVTRSTMPFSTLMYTSVLSQHALRKTALARADWGALLMQRQLKNRVMSDLVGKRVVYMMYVCVKMQILKVYHEFIFLFYSLKHTWNSKLKPLAQEGTTAPLTPQGCHPHQSRLPCPFVVPFSTRIGVEGAAVHSWQHYRFNPWC